MVGKKGKARSGKPPDNSITSTELTAAFDLAERIARNQFANHPLSQWHGEAYDAAMDEVLKAVRQYDPSRGTFGAMVRHYVKLRLRSLRRNKLASAAHQRRIQLRIEFEAGKPHALEIMDIPADMIDHLTERQKSALTQRYTLSATFREIGESAGVTRQAAHRIHKRAIDQLKKRLSMNHDAGG